ncbi:MAG: hypothetical protein ACRDRL_15170, partial [Sciscionella sp.]
HPSVTPHPRLLPSNLLASRLLGGAARDTRPTPVGPAYALGHPGRAAEVPTLLIAVFDNSGSVTRPTGTDPLSNRFAEVDRAFSVVAKKGSRRELGAVLHFDVPCSGEVAPVAITRSGLTRLQAGLRVPPDGAGSSKLAPSMRRAVQLAKAHPEHEATLVVLSDFLLLDADPSAVLTELAAFPGTVQAVVLGGWANAYQPTGCASVTTIRSGDAPGAVAKAMFASLTRHRPGSRAWRECRATGPGRTPGTACSSRISQQISATTTTTSNVPE